MWHRLGFTLVAALFLLCISFLVRGLCALCGVIPE
jgi:hypothetical protein